MLVFPTVLRAGDTHAFARRDGDFQVLAIRLDLRVARDTVLAVPLPVAAERRGEAVEFVSLQQCPELFARLLDVFEPRIAPGMRSLRPELPIEPLGSFEASYVPSAGDLLRRAPDLDTALHEGPADWRDFGFAVFALRPRKPMLPLPGASGAVRLALALRFRTRDAGRLMLPLLPVGTGGHLLYYQRELDPSTGPPPAYPDLGPPETLTSEPSVAAMKAYAHAYARWRDRMEALSASLGHDIRLRDAAHELARGVLDPAGHPYMEPLGPTDLAGLLRPEWHLFRWRLAAPVSEPVWIADSEPPAASP